MVLSCIVTRLYALCVVCCAGPHLCPPVCCLLGCVLFCCGVVLSFEALLCAVRLSSVLCHAGLWLSGPFPCCGVPPLAVLWGVFLCSVAVVCCPVSCPGSASLGVTLLCPVAVLVVCCAVPPCVVFGGTSSVVLRLALLACLRRVVLCCVSLLFGRWLVPGVAACFFGIRWWAWLPGVVFWWCVSALVSLSGRLARCPVAQRLGVVPCGVLFPGAVSCGVMLPCGARLLGSSVLFPFPLVFAFAHYFKNHCKIKNKSNVSIFEN